MKVRSHTAAYTFIEVMIAVFAFFIILAVSVPTLAQIKDARLKNQIIKNVRLLEYYADFYFDKHSATSVSLYELIGPKKPIPELKVYGNETYPEIIYKGELIRVETEKFGVLTNKD
jgi:competence protein ComGC